MRKSLTRDENRLEGERGCEMWILFDIGNEALDDTCRSNVSSEIDAESS